VNTVHRISDKGVSIYMDILQGDYSELFRPAEENKG